MPRAYRRAADSLRTENRRCATLAVAPIRIPQDFRAGASASSLEDSLRSGFSDARRPCGIRIRACLRSRSRCRSILRRIGDPSAFSPAGRTEVAGGAARLGEQATRRGPLRFSLSASLPRAGDGCRGDRPRGGEAGVRERRAFEWLARSLRRPSPRHSQRPRAQGAKGLRDRDPGRPQRRVLDQERLARCGVRPESASQTGTRSLSVHKPTRNP